MRPETHQNLIHPDKDHTTRTTAHAASGSPSKQRPQPPLSQVIRRAVRNRYFPLSIATQKECAELGPTPSGGFAARACFAAAFAEGETRQMEAIGFEPTTPCLQSRCSPS